MISTMADVKILGKLYTVLGEGEPTTSTSGTVGDIYVDIDEESATYGNTYVLAAETDGIYREGLIAEDVNEVRPEMCYKDEDGTLRGVDYKYVTASLLNELQAQKKRSDDLESKVNELCKKLEGEHL